VSGTDILGPWIPLPAPAISAGASILANGVDFGSDDLGSTFKLERQLQSQWCWAAVSVSVRRHFDALSTWRQCSVADAVLTGGGQCCTDGAACNRTFQLDVALNQLDCLADSHSDIEPFSRIRSEIARGRPVCCFIDWQNGTGHFVVVTGWRRSPGGPEMVLVADPASGGTADMPFNALRCAYAKRGRWSWSYRTKPVPTLGAPSVKAIIPADSPFGGRHVVTHG